jgi:hypothetical protein
LEEFFKIVTQMLVGFTSAFFGSLFAIVKFKKEKQWERKEKAY